MSKISQEQKDVIKELISEQCGVSVDKIRDQSKITDELCMDSLDFLQVIINIERDFDISINDDEYDFSETVEGLYSIVEGKIN